MSTFRQIFNTTGRPALMDQYGDPGRLSYAERGRPWTNYDAIISSEQVVENSEEAQGTQDRTVRRTARIPADKLPKAKLTAAVKIDGVAYSVNDTSTSLGFTVLSLIRTEPMERNRRALRQRTVV